MPKSWLSAAAAFALTMGMGLTSLPQSSLAQMPGAGVNNAPTLGGMINSQMAQDRAADQSQMSTYDQQSLFIPKESKFEEISPDAQVAKMGRGVNIIGYDPYWQDNGKGNYKDKHFKAIHEAGFSTVRVVLFVFSHVGSDGQIDPKWLRKLDWVVGTAQKYKLNVILDEHDFDDCSTSVDACVGQLKNVWAQLADRYRNEPNSVMFELLNEPHDALNGDAWNGVFPQVLARVRESNPLRNVIIGPTHWNGFEDLPLLKLPASDQHIIVSFHYYHPMTFTHQGASWVGPELQKLYDVHFGTPEELKTINDDFDKVAAWSKANNRPIFRGEYGAFDKAPMDDRVIWTNAVARAAEARGFATAYWQFSSDFVVYDFDKQKWVEPILHAIIPDTKQ